MRTEYTDTGWKEITTKIITINKISNTPFITLTDWIAFNKKFPKIGRKRKSCNRCKTK